MIFYNCLSSLPPPKKGLNLFNILDTLCKSQEKAIRDTVGSYCD